MPNSILLFSDYIRSNDTKLLLIITVLVSWVKQSVLNSVWGKLG